MLEAKPIIMKSLNPIIRIYLLLQVMVFACSNVTAQYSIVVNGPTEICGPNTTYLSISPVPTGFTVNWYKNNIGVPGIPYFTGPILQSPETGYWTAEVLTSTSPSPQSYLTTAVLIRTNQVYVEAPLGAGSCNYVSLDENASYVANLSLYDFYQWKKNGVSIPGANSFTYNANSTGVYTCLAYLSCGTGLSNPVNVTIENPPTFKTITANGALTFCEGGSVTLSIPPTAGLSYQWRKNSVDIPGATSTTYVATTSGSYNCREISTYCGYINSTYKTVTVNPKTQLTISPIANAYSCMDAPVSLIANPSGGVFSGPGVSGNTFNPNQIGVGGPYQINYDYVNTNGCSSTASVSTSVNSLYNCAIPQNISVSNIAKKTATISWNSSAAPSFKVRYRKTGTTTYLYKNVSWTPCNPTTASLSGLISNTSYTVDVKAVCSNGASAYSNPITFKTLITNPVIATVEAREENNEEEIYEEEIMVFPNPFKDFLKIEIADTESVVKYSIADLSGRIIESGELAGTSHLTTTSWEKGIYFIFLQSENFERHHKIIKQ